MASRNGAGLDPADTGIEARKIVGTGERRESSKPFRHRSQESWALHYGSARSPLVVVVPDDQWPGMYRLAWPDGRRLSDMTNLSRAKDAAVARGERGPPGRNRRTFRWQHTSKPGVGASLARLNGGRVS
jgi:hypothetical protein